MKASFPKLGVIEEVAHDALLVVCPVLDVLEQLLESIDSLPRSRLNCFFLLGLIVVVQSPSIRQPPFEVVEEDLLII